MAIALEITVVRILGWRGATIEADPRRIGWKNAKGGRSQLKLRNIADLDPFCTAGSRCMCLHRRAVPGKSIKGFASCVYSPPAFFP